MEKIQKSIKILGSQQSVVKKNPINTVYNRYKYISAENPIHILFSLQRKDIGDNKVEKAYFIINKIVKRVRTEIKELKNRIHRAWQLREESKIILAKHKSILPDKLLKAVQKSEDFLKKHPPGKLPEIHTSIIYKIIHREFGIFFEKETLLARGLSARFPYVDCDTGSPLFLATSYELGLDMQDMQFVYTRWHVYIRLKKENGQYFNFETTRGNSQVFPLFSDSYQYVFDYNTIDSFFYTFHASLSKDCARAIELSTKAILKTPDFCWPYRVRGYSYVAQKQFKKALKDFNQALKIDSHYTEAYVSRGNMYYKMGQFKNALQDYITATKLYEQSLKRYNTDPRLAKLRKYDKKRLARIYKLISDIYIKKDQDTTDFLGSIHAKQKQLKKIRRKIENRR